MSFIISSFLTKTLLESLQYTSGTLRQVHQPRTGPAWMLQVISPGTSVLPRPARARKGLLLILRVIGPTRADPEARRCTGITNLRGLVQMLSRHCVAPGSIGPPPDQPDVRSPQHNRVHRTRPADRPGRRDLCSMMLTPSTPSHFTADDQLRLSAGQTSFVRPR